MSEVSPLYAIAWACVLGPLLGALASFIAESARRRAQVCLSFSVLALIGGAIVLGYRLFHPHPIADENLITFFSVRATEAQVYPADLHPQIGVHVDGLTSTFLVLALLLLVLVQAHALRALAGGEAYGRFFWSSSLFGGGLTTLIASPNLFQDWLGMGLMAAAVLIVSLHSWERLASVAVARRSFLTVLGGTLVMLFVLVFTTAKLGVHVGSVTPPAGEDVSDPFSFVLLSPAYHAAASGTVLGVGSRSLELLAVATLIVALVLAAQLPFTGWLSGLSGSPVPVMALLASGLLAGPVVLAQDYDLFLVAPHLLSVVAVVGAISAVLLAVFALGTRDLHRIALLTVAAQTGLGFVGLGVGGFSPGMFAVFAAAATGLLLFLVVSVVTGAYRTRDIAELGGGRRLRRTTIALWIWALAAGGLNLAGYHVLAAVFRNEVPGGGHVAGWVQTLCTVAVIVTLLLTALGAGRLIGAVTGGEAVKRRGFEPDRQIREAGPWTSRVTVLSAVLVVVAALIAIPGVNSFEAGGRHIPGLTFSHWVFYGGIRQQLAVSGPALLIAALALVAGLAGGRLLVPRPELADLRGRVLGGRRFTFERVTRPLAGLGDAAGALAANGDRRLLRPLLDGPGEGLELAAAAVERGRSPRAAAVIAVAVVATLLIAAGGVLAATGHFPVNLT